MEKRVLAIHDISCIGRCSLTVALPIISSAGLEVSVLPTAVLSTHTGEFTGYTFRDLTDDMRDIVYHWQTLGEKFDCIFSGYLGSTKQIQIVSDTIDVFKTENTIVVVDPVMGDSGKLYAGLSKDLPKEFLKLCKKADIITPNLTEASLLLGIDYKDENFTEEYIKDILLRLSCLGPEKIVITGISFDKNTIGIATYDSSENKFGFIFKDKIEGFYHGTGDVFSSALIASLLNNYSIKSAATLAADFTSKSIMRTKLSGRPSRYGVEFEKELADFANNFKQRLFR